MAQDKIGTEQNLFGDPELDRYAARYFREVRSGAKSRGKTFELTHADFVEIIGRSGGRCEMTDLLFSGDLVGKWRPWRPSLDRIDNECGYTLDNVRLVVQLWNIGRNDYGDEAMDRLCTARARRLGWSPPQSA